MTPKFNEEDKLSKHNTQRSESVVESELSFIVLNLMGQVCDAAWDCSDWRVTYGFEFFFFFFDNHIVLNLLYFLGKY